MKSGSIDELTRDVFRIYQEIERSNRRIRMKTGLHCITPCGQCCWSRTIEATVTEVIPLVAHLLREQCLEPVIDRLDRSEPGDLCVLFSPNLEPGRDGFCTQYRYRPLVCRTFGFSARRNKDGVPVPQVCRLVKQSDPSSVARFDIQCRTGMVPTMQTYFQRIAALEPIRGYRLMPINQALKDCIDMFFWRKPRLFKIRKAS
ncbi:YkgJ family cysteine cluster protein [bacterium]|nr:YkgJ family cysteine cluster protein [candidate division CSSED10-310 bacterium]